MKKKDVEHQISLMEKSIEPIWKRKNMSVGEYSEYLEGRVLNAVSILKDGKGDKSLVKSTIRDTLEFIAWSSATSELQKASQLLKTILREDIKYGTPKRNNKRR